MSSEEGTPVTLSLDWPGPWPSAPPTFPANAPDLYLPERMRNLRDQVHALQQGALEQVEHAEGVQAHAQQRVEEAQRRLAEAKTRLATAARAVQACRTALAQHEALDRQAAADQAVLAALGASPEPAKTVKRPPGVREETPSPDPKGKKVRRD